MAEIKNIDTVLCLNKCDLVSEEEIQKIREIYRDVYPVFVTSAKTGEGLDEIREYIKGRKVSLAGPSGVGKSSLLNLLIPHAEMETGTVSAKTNRGKHTTRHVEIFDVPGGGMIFDTPGFTSFDLPEETDEDSLADYYPDIARFKGRCRFDNCRHMKEPDCSVREAVEAGLINRTRYESYLANMDEIVNRKKY